MIPFSYLSQQFADIDGILASLAETVRRGDFTLGRALEEFEDAFAKRCKVGNAIGVNSGTDAIFLALKALDIRGDVITPPFSFYATTAAIVHAGARPIFADVRDDFNIDPAAIEASITSRTEAIVPVHWAGRPCDMEAICRIAKRHNLAIVEDAAQAFGSRWLETPCGAWGAAGAFSLHPLKTLNVWGDGGVITTRDADLAARLRSLRNHGLVDRDTCQEWGFNSRLDTIQAAVALHVLQGFERALGDRARVARALDAALSGINGIARAALPETAVSNNYLYTLRVQRRDMLVHYLNAHDVEAKVHYPVPLHLQPAAVDLRYRAGDFPVAERLANETVTLPAHEFITSVQVAEMAGLIGEFYGAARQAAE